MSTVTPDHAKELFVRLRDASDSKRRAKHEAEVLAKEEIERAKTEQKQKQLVQQGIKASMKCSATRLADKAIAEFFYANAIPFSVAESDPTSLYHKMVSCIQSAPMGYVPPNYKKIAGALLDECYDDMWHTIKQRDPDGALISKFGATYVSDGWDSVDKLPLVNSAFISANDGGVYWRSVDTSGKTKTAEYLASLTLLGI